VIRRNLGKLGLLLAIMVGALLGLGLFTFDYAEGLSYFSHDPKACNNCHVMNDQYNSWQHSSHHAAAACVDCHLPIDLIPKYMAKAENGYWHSKGFTFMDFHDPIMIKPHNSKILQENCLRCHGEFVHEIVQGSRNTGDSVQCVHCHKDIAHGARG
jgi:cytochrome c nitrite reductase small subunit